MKSVSTTCLNCGVPFEVCPCGPLEVENLTIAQIQAELIQYYKLRDLVVEMLTAWEQDDGINPVYWFDLLKKELSSVFEIQESKK